MTFVKEELSKTHLRAEITCVRCHGLSAGHANDEDIGATPPDISFKRSQVDTMCLKCHESHDIDPEEIVAGKYPPVCSDCHGTHKINRIKGV
jgi:predicted CXXCH cytochrome family protein